MTTSARLRELSPATIHEMISKRSIVLVDVREQHEHAAERIDGALLLPLSSFDPSALPSLQGREVVFHCGSGKRSAMAVSQCLKRGVAHMAHMTGGIQAWKAAGLPTTR